MFWVDYPKPDALRWHGFIGSVGHMSKFEELEDDNWLRAQAGTLTRHTPSRHTQPAHSVRKSKKPR